MIDSFEMLREPIESAGTQKRMGLSPQRYAVVTLHRPANVDSQEKLAELVRVLGQISDVIDVVFAIHPRTRKKLEEFGLLSTLVRHTRIHATEPLSYVEFMNL